MQKSKKAVVAISPSEVAERKRRRNEERYPECTKLGRVAGKRAELNAFFAWLHDTKRLELGDMETLDRNGRIDPMEYRSDGYDRLVLEYLGIDTKKLEDERRAILQAQQENNT